MKFKKFTGHMNIHSISHPFINASLRRAVQNNLMTTFFMWGYEEITTPVFEYIEAISPGLTGELLEKSYKFVDRESGKLMILRSDITPQVAQMIAGIFSNEPKPLRVCYYGNVFRYEAPHAGREREIFQAGCELAGNSSPDADAEIIALAAEALSKSGIRDFQIVLGHVEYMEGIFSAIGKNHITDQWKDLFKKAVSRKDVDLMERLLNNISIKETHKERLMQLPRLFGKKEVFPQARTIVSTDLSYRALDNLEEIYTLLSYYKLEDKILIDLCDIRGIDYYTGMFFEIFSPSLAYPLGRGGRYDTLISRFGYPIPSVGFAFDVNSIIGAQEDAVKPPAMPGYLVRGKKIYGEIIMDLAFSLRKKGYRVIIDMHSRKNSSIEYARHKGMDYVIIIKGPGKPFHLIDLKSGKERMVQKEEL